MSVFISWSGKDSKSHRVAQLLRMWLPKVIQRLDCFLSSEDISAGALWFEELRGNLEKSKIGILCLTANSTSKPWILFEGGYIARSFDEKKRVYPLLIDISASEMPAPFAIFQGGGLAKEEMFRLVQMINQVAGLPGLDDETLHESFDLRWPQFKQEIQTIVSQKESILKASSSREPWASALEETLQLVRGIASGNIQVTQRVIQLHSDKHEVSSNPAILDLEASSIFERLVTMVEKRRALISSWVRCVSHVQMDGRILKLYFPAGEEHACSALQREAQQKFLLQCVRELGCEDLVLAMHNPK